MKFRLYFLGICFLLTAFIASAGATTLTTRGVYGGSTGTWTYGSSSVTGSLGMLRVDLDLDDDSTADFTSPAFCVEYEADINPYNTTYNATLLTLNSQTFKAAWLMDNYASTTDGIQMAALQFAIWHIVETSGFNLTSGPTFTLYNDMLSALSVFDSANGNYNYLSDIYRVAQLTDATGANIQDLIIKVNPVPEPATMALFGIGLLGITLVGRKRR